MEKQIAVLEKHFQLSLEIHRICEIRSHLLDEFLNKKAIETPKRKAKFMFQDKHTKKCYESFFMGKGGAITSFDIFPCSFQCWLEEVMLREWPIKDSRSNPDSETLKKLKIPEIWFPDTSKFVLIDVYYNLKDVVRCQLFEKGEWQLSTNSNITTQDMTVLSKFKQRWMNFFDLTLFELDQHSITDPVSRIKREKKRVEKRLSWIK